jgi:hypothetical protein
MKSVLVISVASTLVENEFIGIVINSNHPKIPNHYPQWAKLSMKIFIFIILFLLLMHLMNRHKIIDIW